MKYIIIHAEGFADIPSHDLDGHTPLEAALTPNLDRLASGGEIGLATIPADVPMGGKDVMGLALLGYDPRKVHAGPAPFEAIGQGIAVGEHDVVFRSSMVTLRAGAAGTGTKMDVKKLAPSVVLDDDSAAGLEDDEARELIEAINEQLGSESIQFYPGAGHRHLMVWVGGKTRATCLDPHTVVGKPIGDSLPTGDGSDILRKLMEASLVILSTHPVNESRHDAGLKPINCVWLWGQGRAPQLSTLSDERQITGMVLSESDLHRGLGIAAGLEACEETWVTQSGDIDFSCLVDLVVRALGKHDLTYVHVHMPVQSDQSIGPKEKVTFIEQFDRALVGGLLDRAAKLGPHRIILLCEMWTPAGSRPVPRALAPYLFYEGPVQSRQARRFTEGEAHAEAEKSGARDATKLMARLVPRA